jgi:hypothetical protein
MGVQPISGAADARALTLLVVCLFTGVEAGDARWPRDLLATTIFHSSEVQWNGLCCMRGPGVACCMRCCTGSEHRVHGHLWQHYAVVN